MPIERGPCSIPNGLFFFSCSCFQQAPSPVFNLCHQFINHGFHFNLSCHVDAFFDFEGYAFVKFSNREMALAAIKGLNKTFTMRVKLIYLIDTYYSVHFQMLAKVLFLITQGCDHPLIVRFADPKKPKTGESRFFFLTPLSFI